jgi:imidazolonepropionase-like amidohydrolase
VMVRGTHELPLRRDDPFDAAFTVAAKLHAAGVRFCIAPADQAVDVTDRNLAYEAAKAAAHGLPAAEALKASHASCIWWYMARA